MKEACGGESAHLFSSLSSPQRHLVVVRVTVHMTDDAVNQEPAAGEKPVC